MAKALGLASLVSFLNAAYSRARPRLASVVLLHSPPTLLFFLARDGLVLLPGFKAPGLLPCLFAPSTQGRAHFFLERQGWRKILISFHIFYQTRLF